jgi:cell wall assembly regulator SMI1
VTYPDLQARLRRVEFELGVTFPSDYREFIVASGKVDRDFGGSWLMLYGIDELVSLNQAFDRSQSHPGLVFIGSDGGGEGVGLDFRNEPPSVVLVNWVSAGWHEAIVQAETFAEFMAQRNAGAEYNFDQ